MQQAQDLLPHLSAETIGLFVFPDGVSSVLEHFFAGLEGTLSSERFPPHGVGELATTTFWGANPISTATTKSSPMGSLRAALR